MAQRDPHEVLGVDRDASQATVKAAWRCLAREHHPDLAADAAMLVPPGDAGALVAGIDQVLADPGLPARLRELGPSRAAGFTWAEAARKTAAVYRRVVGSDWH